MRALLLPLIVLTFASLLALPVTGCGSGAGADNNDAAAGTNGVNAGDGAGESSGYGSAGVDGKMQELADATASRNSSKKELRLAFCVTTLTDEQKEKLVDSRSDFVMNPPSDPYLVLVCDVDDPSQPLSPDNLTGWRVVYWNFHEKDPMTMGGMHDQVVQHLSGELKPGGKIRVTLSKEDALDFQPPARTYRCELNATVELLWAE